MRKYNISANLVCTSEQLYDKATSAVQMNGSIGEWFRTTVGVRQGCLLSPTLFNIFLERIMSDALEEHDGKVSTGGRNITNLQFADDTDALAEEEQELEALVESLNKTCTRYKMEISAERLLNISYKDHVTNEEVRRKIQAAIGEYDELLTLVKKRKLRWFGHVSRSSGLAKTILQGTVKGKRGRQKKRWEDNIKEWTGLHFASSTRAAENRSRWKGTVANSSVVPRRPSKAMG